MEIGDRTFTEGVMLDPQEFEEFKKWLIGHLLYGPTTVTFTKKDGTERIMKCTLKKDLISAPIKNEKEDLLDLIKNTALPVWDIDANTWKSFRWDSVKRVEFTIGD